jgi:ABC-type nitrate/sulfonate/bicarbonate transport system permease component
MIRHGVILRFMERHPRWSQLIVVLLFLAFWEVAARFWVDKMFLSPPSRVYSEIGRVFGAKGIPAALMLALFELSVAFIIALAIGLIVGLVIGLGNFARRSFMPIVLLLYGIPQITILPLFVLYFGIGAPSKIAFGVTHGVFPIILSIVGGVQNQKSILTTSALSMGANRWHILRYVVLPHLVPSLFSGMRLGMTGVLLGVLLAELYVSTAGIGYFTATFSQAFDPTRLLGLISILAGMAIVLNEIVRRAETYFSKWRNP